jgi:hypothetical protein
MSIQVRTMAKQLGLSCDQTIQLLHERRIIPADAKSPRYLVDNISAGALREEFASKSRGAAVGAVRPKKTRARSAVARETPKGFEALEKLARIETPVVPIKLKTYSTRVLEGASAWYGRRKQRRLLHPDQPFLPGEG